MKNLGTIEKRPRDYFAIFGEYGNEIFWAYDSQEVREKHYKLSKNLMWKLKIFQVYTTYINGKLIQEKEEISGWI